MSVSISPGLLPWKLEVDPSTASLTKGNPTGASKEVNFGQYLWQGVNEVNDMQHDANDAIHQLLTGGDVNQAEVMTTVQKAEMAFRMLTQIRNKMLSAYEEINAIRF